MVMSPLPASPDDKTHLAVAQNAAMTRKVLLEVRQCRFLELLESGLAEGRLLHSVILRHLVDQAF
jgi:hypothetical protein